MPLKRAALRVRRLLACGLLAFAAAAEAAPTCLLTATPMAYGSYDTLALNAVLVSATVTVSCVTALGPLSAIPYTLSLGPSSTSGTMVRALAGPLGARLQYNLYTSAARTTVWGNGSSGTQTVASSVTPAALGVPAVRAHTVYGSVPARQGVRIGAYADSLLVTVDY